jgi:hypothetical protein
MTLKSLLERILVEVNQGEDIMIIYHGTPGGLSLPIHTHQRSVKADDRVLHFLMDSNLSRGELASRLILSEDRAADLKQLGESVRALRPQCVLLRACNTGRNRPVLQTAKRFFGAGRLGAPDLRDAYVPLSVGNPNPSETYRQRWLARHPRNHVYEVPVHGWLALATSGIVAGQTSFSLHGLTDSRRSVGFWMDVYLSRLHSAQSFSGGSVPLHAVVAQAASFPLVFPGEDEYTAHLVMV